MDLSVCEVTIWIVPGGGAIECSSVFSLDWPVRTVGFSHDGQLLATGSEDHSVDIAWVENGKR